MGELVANSCQCQLPVVSEICLVMPRVPKLVLSADMPTRFPSRPEAASALKPVRLFPSLHGQPTTDTGNYLKKHHFFTDN
jgi:hypothetical protein